MHTGDINFPQLSSGPLLRTGKVWLGTAFPVCSLGSRALGWFLPDMVGAPLWTHLGTAEVDTGVI